MRQFGLNSTLYVQKSQNSQGFCKRNWAQWKYLKIVIALRLKLQGSILELSAEIFGGLVIFPSLQGKPGGEAGFWEGSA